MAADTQIKDMPRTAEIPSHIGLEISPVSSDLQERFQVLARNPIYGAILGVLTSVDEDEQPRFGNIYLTGSFVHHLLREPLFETITQQNDTEQTIDRSYASDADFLADISYDSEQGQQMVTELLQLGEGNDELNIYVDDQKYINKVVIEENGRRIAEVVFLPEAAEKARVARAKLAEHFPEERGLIIGEDNLDVHMGAQTVVQEAQAIQISRVNDTITASAWKHLPVDAYPLHQAQATGFGLDMPANETAASAIRVANEASIYTPDRIAKQIQIAETYDELSELLSMNLYTRLDVFRSLAKEAELPQYFPYGYDWNALDLQDMSAQIIARADELGIPLEMLSQQVIAKEKDFQKKAMKYWLRAMIRKPVVLMKGTVRYNLLTDLLPNDSTHFQELLGWNDRTFAEQASPYNKLRASDGHFVASGRLGDAIRDLVETNQLTSSTDIFAVMIAGLGEYREEEIRAMAEEITQFWPEEPHRIEGWHTNMTHFDSRVNAEELVAKALRISRAINPIYPENKALYENMDFGASVQLWRAQLLDEAGIQNEEDNPALYAQIHVLLQKLLLTNSSVVNSRVINTITSVIHQDEEPS